MRLLKISLPVFLVFLFAMVGLACYFVPHKAVFDFISEAQVWQKIIYTVTIFMGVYSLLAVHYHKIKRQQKGWGYSGVVFFFFSLLTVFALYNNGAGPLKAQTTAYDGVRWSYDAFIQPIGAMVYAMLGFFICSAAVRTLRAKTLEAGVLLAAALIVMLGQVPIGRMLWDKVPVISGWLLDVPNMAVKRAVGFGMCVGGVGMSLRIMFGIERSYLGGD
jgi:hypothetical protein